MTLQEVEKLRVINQTIDKVITIKTAAEMLGLSERQVLRLKGGVLNHGPSFLIHKNRGRAPAHAVSDPLCTHIVSLKQTKYPSANFAHFHELLAEMEGIHVSYPTVYRTLTQAGIKSPKIHRQKKAHHRRKRQSQAGILVQMDASPFAWIPNEKPITLHGAIDDATGAILGLHFSENECLHGYFQVMNQLLKEYGRPAKLYCDRHTIFFSPKDTAVSLEDQLQGVTEPLTQFGRAMQELGIQMIKARSPQAKGRIERLWNTLQSRLPVMFELSGITSLEQANAFLPEMIRHFNLRFAVVPQDSLPAFRPVDSSCDLTTVLCIKHTRTLIDQGAFSYQGLYYQLMQHHKPVQAMPKAKVTVLDHPLQGIRCIYKDALFQTAILDQRPKKMDLVEKSTALKMGSPPSADHPWRKSAKNPVPLYGFMRDAEMLAMLDDLFSSVRPWA